MRGTERTLGRIALAVVILFVASLMLPAARAETTNADMAVPSKEKIENRTRCLSDIRTSQLVGASSGNDSDNSVLWVKSTHREIAYEVLSTSSTTDWYWWDILVAACDDPDDWWLDTYYGWHYASNGACGKVKQYADSAANYFASGDLSTGYQRLGWASHYLMDLGNPYHYIFPSNIPAHGWFEDWIKDHWEDPQYMLVEEVQFKGPTDYMNDGGSLEDLGWHLINLVYFWEPIFTLYLTTGVGHDEFVAGVRYCLSLTAQFLCTLYEFAGYGIFSAIFSDAYISDWTKVTTGGTISRDTGNGMISAPSMKLERTQTSGDVKANHYFARQSGEVVFEVKEKLSTTSANRWLMLTLADGSSPVIYFGFVDGYYKWKVGSSWQSTGWTYNTLWNQITLKVHLASGSFDIIINGVAVKSGCKFHDGVVGPHFVNNINLYAGQAGQSSLTAWVDDIIVRRGTCLFIDQMADQDLSDWTRIQTGGSVTVDTSTGFFWAPSMKLARTTANAETSAAHTFAAQTNHATVEARIKVSTTATNKFVYFMVNNGANYVGFVMFQNGNIMYYYQGGSANLGSYSAYYWYTIKFDMWLASGKCDVYLDGYLKVLGAKFYDGVVGPHTINTIKFQCGNWDQSGVTCWVDDVIVTS